MQEDGRGGRNGLTLRPSILVRTRHKPGDFVGLYPARHEMSRIDATPSGSTAGRISARSPGVIAL